MLCSQLENLGENDSWSTLLGLFVLEISSSVTCYCLIMQTGAALECHPAGSWAMHLDFCILDSRLLSCCHTPVSELAGNGCDRRRAAQGLSHTGHNCHPCTETLPAMPNTGSTAENCSFFLNSFSALSQIPWGCRCYSKRRGRPTVKHAWNYQILEKTFPKVSRGKIVWQHLG